MNIEGRLLKSVRLFLQLVGATFLVSLALLGVYRLLPQGFPKHNNANMEQGANVSHILNWCGIGGDKLEKVIHNYTSVKSATGDHLDAYAMKITHVDTIKLFANTGISSRWFRGNALPGIISDALTFVGAWQSEVPWFPEEAKIRTSDYFVYPINIRYHGVSLTSTDLIIFIPMDRLVYYISIKM